MKKVTYLVVLMFSLVLMSTSCCKEDDPINDDPTSGELYPAFVGTWVCDNVLDENGVLDTGLPKYNITITNETASWGYSIPMREYVSWEIQSGNKLFLDGDGNYENETFQIVKNPTVAPTNKMELKNLDSDYTYQLTKQ
jgi:hypothetical protein